MNEKEIAEIRRRFKPEKSNITNIRGCYVNNKGEIVSEFRQSITMMPEDEAEKFLGILKRTLSGTLHKNLIDIEFTTQQVVDSPEHKLLMALRDSALENEEAVRHFFEQVIQSITMEEHYLIILAYDTYDIPYRSKDGERQDDASSEVFSYFLCSICPVKLTKPALGYYAYENEFRSCTADWVVSPPEMGFMFPSFDDRSTNIYNALYYTRNTAENHQAFVDTVFQQEAPMPAAEQKETFQEILGNTLEDECDFGIVQAVHDELNEMIEEHKVNKEETPLMISKGTVKQILHSRGISEAHVAAFEEKFDEQFGAEANLSPKNIIDTKQVAVTTPDVKIQISAGREDLVETRIIDGTKYILIRAADGVEVNGIPIQIS